MQVLQGKHDGAGEKETERATSPFVSKSLVHPQDLRRGAIMGSKTNNGSPQTTPKRTMSPLRRFNKVAPSPVKPPNGAAAILSSTISVPPLISAMAQPSSLQSNSASILDEKRDLEKVVALEERPGSAPLDKTGREGEDGESRHNVAKPISLEPVIVVRSKNGDLVIQESENQNKEGNKNTD